MYFQDPMKKNLTCSQTKQRPPLLSMRFPQKLWTIVNECKSGAIQWSKNGTSLILNYPKFQEEYLDIKMDIFKTSNISSFIRQLNLYGFRKVNHYNRESLSEQNADIHEFKNHNFIRGRIDLLEKVSRKPSAPKSRVNCKTRDNHGCRSSRLEKSQLAFQQALTRQNSSMMSLRKGHFSLDTPNPVLGGHINNSFWNQAGWTHLRWNIPSSYPSSSPSSSEASSLKDTTNSNSYPLYDTLNSEAPLSFKPHTQIKDEEEMSNYDETTSLDSLFSNLDSGFCDKIYQFLADESDKENLSKNEMSPCNGALPDNMAFPLSNVNPSLPYEPQPGVCPFSVGQWKKENVVEPDFQGQYLNSNGIFLYDNFEAQSILPNE